MHIRGDLVSVIDSILKCLLIAPPGDGRRIAPEIGFLSRLKELNVSNNEDLSCPPPEIYNQGTQVTLSFLRRITRGTTHAQVRQTPTRTLSLSTLFSPCPCVCASYRLKTIFPAAFCLKKAKRILTIHVRLYFIVEKSNSRVKVMCEKLCP